MTATITQARNEMNALFKAAAGNLHTVWDDVTKGKPSGKQPWARVTVRHESGNQASLSDSGGKRRFRRTGTLYIQLFTTPGDGLKDSDTLSNMALKAYEGKTTPSGIWFRRARMRELGLVEGYYQVNVLVDFEYDEVH